MSTVAQKIAGKAAKLASTPLPFRKFSGESLVPAELQLDTIKFMSYNILADSLVARRLYKPEEMEFIPIDRRVRMIAGEIDTLQPDIVLFQEKQKGEDTSVGLLNERGFEVVFVYQSFFKCRRAPRDDGLLSAYRTDKFTLLRKFEMDFYIKNDPIISTQNVAQFMLLESKTSGKILLSVNCHLLFNRDRGDTKFFQAALIMSAITEIQKLYRTPS